MGRKRAHATRFATRCKGPFYCKQQVTASASLSYLSCKPDLHEQFFM